MREFGIYLHIPFCRSRCDYCGFLSSCDFSREEEYFEGLCGEIAAARENGICATLYVGGGTPSSVSPTRLARAVGAVREKFPFSEGGERTVECNPDSFDRTRAAAYAEMGFNRVSLGVQSFSNRLLAGVGRRHDAETAMRAAELALEVFGNASVDLMLGLPGQGEREVREDLARIRELGIPHVSVYGLKVEEGTPLFARGYAPDEDLCADLYELCLGELAGAGLMRYEVSNFAKPGFESRHNLRYWRREDYLGFGVGAHSCVGNRRFWNGGLDEFLRGEGGGEERLSPEEVEYETIILALRTREGLERGAFERKFGCEFAEKYADAVKKCGRFLEVTEKFVRVSPEGFYLLNSLLVNF